MYMYTNVYVHMGMYTNVYVHMGMYTNVYVHMGMYTHVYACRYTHVPAHVFTYLTTSRIARTCSTKKLSNNLLLKGTFSLLEFDNQSNKFGFKPLTIYLVMLPVKQVKIMFRLNNI
jgi:hypothetical protein